MRSSQDNPYRCTTKSSKYLRLYCRNQRHLCATAPVLQALELARQTNDNIKDEIWHELAQVQHKYWQHDSAAQLAKLQKLQGRMQHVLQEQHLREQQVCTLCLLTSGNTFSSGWVNIPSRSSRERLLREVMIGFMITLPFHRSHACLKHLLCSSKRTVSLF